MGRAPKEENGEEHTPLLSIDFAPFSKLAFLGLVERRNNSDLARLVFEENDLCSAGVTEEHSR